MRRKPTAVAGWKSATSGRRLVVRSESYWHTTRVMMMETAMRYAFILEFSGVGVCTGGEMELIGVKILAVIFAQGL